MSSSEGPLQRGGRGRGSDRGRGAGAGRGAGGGRRRGEGGGDGRGGDRGSSRELPFRPGPNNNNDSGRSGSFRGFGRGRGDDAGRRGGRGGGGYFNSGPTIYSPAGGIPSPSTKVAQTEDALETALVEKPTSGANPKRPGFGTQGQQVLLYANYFELKSVGKGLFRYHVDIDGGLSRRTLAGKKAKQIIRLLLEEHFPQRRRSIVTDYKSTVISHLKILSQDQEPATYDVHYRSEYDDEYPERPEVYRVTLQFTGRVDPAGLLNYLTSSDADAMFESKADVLQAMNIAVGHHPKSDMSIASLGANKHYTISGGLEEKFSLGAGLEALRGYFVSVRAATARILVNVQVKYVACYQDGPLDQVIGEYRRAHFRDVDSLRRFVSKLKVRVTHIQRKNKNGQDVPRIKTIVDLATRADGKSLPNPPKVGTLGAGPKDVQFFLEAPGPAPPQKTGPGSKKGKKPAIAGPKPSGQYVTVADFFKQNYNITVDPKMPVVNVGTREQPSYLPVEVCSVEPGQAAKTKLSPSQTREMMKFAVRNPAQNAHSIVTKGVEMLGIGHPANPTLVDFGIQPNPSLVTVPGRVFSAPKVYYKDGKANQKLVNTNGGSWNMKSIRFSTSSKLTTWTWMLLATREGRQYFESPEHLNSCLEQFTDKLKEVGVMAQPPKPGTRLELSEDTYEDDINAQIARLIHEHKPTLILTILPFNDTGIYNCIKKACDLNHGVRNINVLAERFKDRKPQYFANVALKFNLKLGGINQLLRPTELGIIGAGKTMLVGLDVTHPSPGSAEGAPSVAGMVASIDSCLGQWPAEIRVQTARQEMVDDIDSMLKAHLRRWARAHKEAYPENIIVYRDGVSEGQYETVTRNELPLLKAACKDVYPASDTAKGLPRFSIIIVGKRHHTRFYPTCKDDADSSYNPKNGTIVDRGITEARNWDFYLQAHTALKGTARPAHYYTVWDEIFVNLKPAAPFQNTADILEGLTHHMCYLFGRATKAVSICPPAYYADLVCTRARCYLSRAFDPATPSGSVITGSAQTVSVSNSDVRIHPNVADTMFYI